MAEEKSNHSRPGKADKPAKCYLCGSTEKLTRDHVPPKGFFPPPRPSNLITVLCCEACNNAFAKADEAARMWFCGLLGASKAGEWILENKVLKNTVRRMPGERDAMLATMRDVELLTEDGLVEASAFSIPREKVIPFMVRIVKGLLSHYYPQYDYTAARWEVRHVPQTEKNLVMLQQVRDLLPYDCRGIGVFQYRGGLTSDSGPSGIWILVFYEAIIFLVEHSSNNWNNHLK